MIGKYNSSLGDLVAADTGVLADNLPEVRTWDFQEWPIRDREHFLELHRKGVFDAHMFSNMEVIENAKEVLQRLSDKGIHITIVTHRLCLPGYGQNKKVISDTVHWLDENEIPYQDICFVSDKKRVDASFYLDDAVHNVESLRGAGIDAVIFDQPYNQDCVAPRAHSWLDFEQMVDNYLTTGKMATSKVSR